MSVVLLAAWSTAALQQASPLMVVALPSEKYTDFLSRSISSSQGLSQVARGLGNGVPSPVPQGP